MYRTLASCFIFAISFYAANVSAQSRTAETPPNFANGAKVGEVTQTTAIVWVRLTQNKESDLSALPILASGLKPREKSKVAMPTNVAPGTQGEFQIKYWLENEGNTKSQSTSWHQVDSPNDFIRQIHLKNLKPGSRYKYSVIARSNTKSKNQNKISGKFRTAPEKTNERPVRFIVSTCQAVRSIDDRQGHKTYKGMLARAPDFFVHTGDILYYDKAPLAKTAEEARAKWHVMFGYPANREFFQNVSSYFMKDDHDTLKNDCWPGQKYGQLTFAQGLEIFRQQVPMGKNTYRTIRWGKHLQIWMTENRDFRSPNRMPDGPEKTILGSEQKAWLKNSIRNSDAKFRFVITPGPIVGPDKRGKNDNHSNKGFNTEGQELRDFLSKQKNLFVICGDRHWQYCSKDPKTGLLELGCGPINDQHKFGGNPGHNNQFHRYFGAKGGFLEIQIQDGTAVANWFGQKKNSKDFVILHREDLK